MQIDGPDIVKFELGSHALVESSSSGWWEHARYLELSGRAPYHCEVMECVRATVRLRWWEEVFSGVKRARCFAQQVCPYHQSHPRGAVVGIPTFQAA